MFSDQKPSYNADAGRPANPFSPSMLQFLRRSPVCPLFVAPGVSTSGRGWGVGLNIELAGLVNAMDQTSINEQEWANPDNWSDYEIGLYFSKRDSRVWVPKRERELGWTFNLAHARGALGFMGVLLAPAGLLLVILAVILATRG